MDSDRIRTAIEEAVSASAKGIEVPGIIDAAVRKVALSSAHLVRVAAQLEEHRCGEISLFAEVELFLRISNIDLLSSIECAEFHVMVNADGDDLQAVAGSEKDWRVAWERGVEPIKQAALQSMEREIWNMDATLAEDSYTFQAAMVLLGSDLLGPYADRLATFLGYPPRFVEVVAARLFESA